MQFPKILLVTVLALGLAACSTTNYMTTTDAGTTVGDPMMGDWQGYRVSTAGTVLPLAIQVISYGDNLYDAAVRSEERRVGKEC